MENEIKIETKIPTNDEFVKMVEDYHTRFPSMGTPIHMAYYIRDMYKEVNIDVKEQLNHYLFES